MRKLIALSISAIAILFYPINIQAWNDEVTHQDLSEKAAESSVLNPAKGNYLKNLGFDKSLAEAFTLNGESKKVREWIRFGSLKEDSGNILNGRYYNHFHDPLKSWEQAGLSTSYPIINGISSILWALDTSNDWSWQVARSNYLLGLTSSTDKKIKRTVPFNSRNDGHMWPDGFEAYVDENVNPLNFAASSLSIPTTAVSASAPKQFWDSETYDGSNPSASTSIGLAEYTNANFASGDTIFTENNLNDWNPLNDAHYFPHPAKSDTSYYEEPMNKQWMGLDVYRKYFEKDKGGETIKHFAYAGRLYKYHIQISKGCFICSI